MIIPSVIVLRLVVLRLVVLRLVVLRLIVLRLIVLRLIVLSVRTIPQVFDIFAGGDEREKSEAQTINWVNQ